MNPALLLHDRQGLLQRERDFLINTRSGHRIIRIHDLEDPPKKAHLLLMIEAGISGQIILQMMIEDADHHPWVDFSKLLEVEDCLHSCHRVFFHKHPFLIVEGPGFIQYLNGNL